MNIRENLKTLNKTALIDIRNYINYRLLDSNNCGIGDMTVVDFVQKLKNEKITSFRLMTAVRDGSDDFDFVYQITRTSILTQRNMGLGTWAEFIKLRGY